MPILSAPRCERMLSGMRDLFSRHKELIMAHLRHHFNTSRRYILAWLEYLDSQGITVRSGDARRLKG